MNRQGRKTGMNVRGGEEKRNKIKEKKPGKKEKRYGEDASTIKAASVTSCFH